MRAETFWIVWLSAKSPYVADVIHDATDPTRTGAEARVPTRLPTATSGIPRILGSARNLATSAATTAGALATTAATAAAMEHATAAASAGAATTNLAAGYVPAAADVPTETAASTAIGAAGCESGPDADDIAKGDPTTTSVHWAFFALPATAEARPLFSRTLHVPGGKPRGCHCHGHLSRLLGDTAPDRGHGGSEGLSNVRLPDWHDTHQRVALWGDCSTFQQIHFRHCPEECETHQKLGSLFSSFSQTMCSILNMMTPFPGCALLVFYAAFTYSTLATPE